MKYGIPAALMLCLEWWAYEILSLYAGMLSIKELAANVILFNIITFLFMFPMGIANAVCALVGNSLGDEKPRIAKVFRTMALILIEFITAVLIILMIIFRYSIAYIYTDQQEVADLVAQTIPFFALMMFFDNFQGVSRGIVRAIGYQKYGCVTALIGFW